MAKNHNLFGLLLFVALCFCGVLGDSLLTGAAGPTSTLALAPAPDATQVSLRQQILSVARSELGVSERSGRNDGERVGQYLAYCGLGEGYEWCSAFVSWCFG